MPVTAISNTKYKEMMLVICNTIYGILGITLGMRTNIFLFIQQDYLDNYQHIATLILISGIGMQLTLFWAGHLLERIGFHRVLILGVTATAIPLALMSVVNSAVRFDLMFLLFMLGYGILVIVLNLFVSHLLPQRKGQALLMLHLFFAIGALIGPRLISWCNDIGIPWQKIISLTSLPLFLILIILAITGIMATEAVRQAYPAKQAIKLQNAIERKERNLKFHINDPFLWLFIVIFICSQVWEYGIGTWFVIFANKTKGLSSSEAAIYLTLFYATYPLVSILFSRIIHKFNLILVILGAFLSCISFGGLGMMTGHLFFYSLTGVGIALMYPGIMAAMQQIFGAGSTKKIGFITMAGGLIQYAAIWSVGLMSDHWGIGRGFTSMLGYLVIGAVATTLIYLKRRHQTSTKTVLEAK